MENSELPTLDIDIITITLHRPTGRVEVNHEGMNYLEAIGVLSVALTQIQETPFAYEYDMEDDDDSDS